jgi:hypothetical protein
MTERVELDLSGIEVHLVDVASAVARQLRSDWAPFVAAPGERAPWLELRVVPLASALPPGEFDPGAMRAETTAARARFAIADGTAEVDASGRGTIGLRRGLGSREYWAIANLLRACLAWRLLARRAALLHAAGLVIDGRRAFLLVGPAGAGKSTFAALGERAGARVLSDDLVLVDAGADPPLALGAPFRSSHVAHRADYRPGRFPLAAILFPRHGRPPALAASSALLARTRILANLPFVAEGMDRDPRVSDLVEALVARVPCLELTFDRDAGFVELLAAGPPGPVAV